VLKEENIRLIFGLKLKLLRQEKAMSLAELSKQAGISVSYINEIEKGKKYPKNEKIFALAEALGTTYDWMVSLKLDKKLGPLAEILHSNILSELPLSMFGIQPQNLLEIISNAPAKLNAFITTLVDISRNHNLSVENFYFSALRSYQELHLNYFGEIEAAAEQFRSKVVGRRTDLLAVIEEYLQKKAGYTINYEGLEQFQDLHNIRSVLRENGRKYELMVNPRLTEQQRMFVLSRELGYLLLNASERSFAYSWGEVGSFEQVLNDFNATYFAGALLIPERRLIEDVNRFFAQEQFDPQMLLNVMYANNSSPETFMHRLTSILPKHFGLNRLFFIKLSHIPDGHRFVLTKELHLAGLHKPHATVSYEHYCRRWQSVELLRKVDAQVKAGSYKGPVCDAQVSDYFDSVYKYFCFTIARPQYPRPDFQTSLTVGILLDRKFREAVKFWNDPKVNTRVMNHTCERCAVEDCRERAAPPYKVLERQKHLEVKTALQQIFEHKG